MAKSFRCQVVTPSEAVFDEQITYASFPAWDGQHGVMVGQSPLLSRLASGSLRIERADGRRQHFWVDGGFAQIGATGLTILTERALAPETLSADEAATELAAANRVAVAGSGRSIEERRRVETAQERARTKRAMALAAVPR